MASTDDGDQLLTVAELAERWRCGEMTIYRRIQAGRLHPINTNPGGDRPRWLIRLSEVVEIENQQ